MKKFEYGLILLVFCMIVIGFWAIDFIKSSSIVDIKNNNLKTINSKNSQIDISKMLLSRTKTSPVGYILDEQKSILIDLTDMKLFLLENGLIKKSFDILHKGPRHLWFQSPTNYFNAGAKYKLLRSSIVDVFMPYSVQIHEDFFVHGIPYYPNGERVSSQFSGGCLRVTDENAQEIFNFVEYGTKMIVYNQSIKNDQIASGYFSPIDPEKYWIRQDFNSPLKIHGVYLQHAGVDMSTKEAEPVKAIYHGKISLVQIMGNEDYGFGNTVVIEHVVNDQIFYSLYAHLEKIEKDIYIGKEINGGDIIGVTGASGYGCQNYWRIGKDGCNESGFLDRHLHFEIKSGPTLINSEGENDCPQKNQELGPCFGYVPTSPLKYGYFDPIKILTEGF